MDEVNQPNEIIKISFAISKIQNINERKSVKTSKTAQFSSENPRTDNIFLAKIEIQKD